MIGQSLSTQPSPITFFVRSHQSDDIVIVSDTFFSVYNLTQQETIFNSYDAPLTPPLSTIRAGCFSLKDDYLILSDDTKHIYTFETASWTLVSRRESQKRIMELCPTNDGIIAADKHGDIYRYPLVQPDPPTYLLGHVSMLTCARWSPLGFVLSGDRDEKIRVSRYPEGHRIETFCLGHTQFVTHLLLDPTHPDQLVSAGGEPALYLWHWPDGRLLKTILIPKTETASSASNEDEHSIVVRSLSGKGDWLAVVVESRAYVLLYHHHAFSRKIDVPKTVLCACFDHLGALWIGTTEGCLTYHLDTETCKPRDIMFPLQERALENVFHYETLRKEEADEEPTQSFLDRVELKKRKKEKKEA